MIRTIFIIIAASICATVCNATQSTDTVVIKNGDRQIFGILNHPDKGSKKPVPLAIIAHGFNGTHEFGRNYFEPLAKEGYATYVFDFPCGSTRSRSDNNTLNMSVRDEESDLMAVVNYFSKRPEIDGNKIVLIGESQGGLVSALAASENPEKIHKLVLVFPAFCIPEHHNGKFNTVEEIPDTTYIWKVPLGKKFFTELRDIKPFEVLSSYKRPVLIIHGDKDSVVPLSDSQKAIGIYPDVRLKVIPGAGHGFNPSDFRLSTSYITDFLHNN